MNKRYLLLCGNQDDNGNWHDTITEETLNEYAKRNWRVISASWKNEEIISVLLEKEEVVCGI